MLLLVYIYAPKATSCIYDLLVMMGFMFDKDIAVSLAMSLTVIRTIEFLIYKVEVFLQQSLTLSSF